MTENSKAQILIICFLILLPLGLNAQQSFFNKYSSKEDLILSDTFLLKKQRLYPTGLESGDGKFYLEAGDRWVDIDAVKREIISTTSRAQGLIDHWQIADVDNYPDKHRLVFKVQYLTKREPYYDRAGRLGMIVINYLDNKQIETISFSISDDPTSYSGMGTTLYIYRFAQENIPINNR